MPEMLRIFCVFLERENSRAYLLLLLELSGALLAGLLLRLALLQERLRDEDLLLGRRGEIVGRHCCGCRGRVVVGEGFRDQAENLSNGLSGPVTKQ